MKNILPFVLVMGALNLSCSRAEPLAAPTQPIMNTTESKISSPSQTETADFGGGCFWCMEAVFERLPGVVSVTSGFAGGTTENPTYQQVCTETTGRRGDGNRI